MCPSISSYEPGAKACMHARRQAKFNAREKSKKHSTGLKPKGFVRVTVVTTVRCETPRRGEPLVCSRESEKKQHAVHAARACGCRRMSDVRVLYVNMVKYGHRLSHLPSPWSYGICCPHRGHQEEADGANEAQATDPNSFDAQRESIFGCREIQTKTHGRYFGFSWR